MYSSKKMPLVERVELMRPVQMMTGVLCVVTVANSYAVTHVHVFSTCSAMFHALPILQGIKTCYVQCIFRLLSLNSMRPLKFKSCLMFVFTLLLVLPVIKLILHVSFKPVDENSPFK